MNRDTIISLCLGGVALLISSYTFIKLLTGQPLQLSDVVAVSSSLMVFVTHMTYGLPSNRNRLKESDELGQHIIAKSAKLSYFLLSLCIALFIMIEQLLFGTINPFLLLLSSVALLLLPCIEFFVARTYR